MNKNVLFVLLALSPLSSFAKEVAIDSTKAPSETVAGKKVTDKEKAKPNSKWSGEAELGYLKTSGNTDTESLHTKGKVVNERTDWKHQATIEIINKDENGTSTADKTFVTGKSDYNIDDLSYLFITLSYEKDKFSGYDYQYTESIGYGYHLIKQADLKLDLEVGAGARQSKLSTGTSTSEGLAKGAADLEWKFSKTSVLTQHLSVEAGEDNTISRSVTAVKVQVVGNLSAKLSHSIKNSSDVPVGTKKTDTETVVTLVYSF